MIVLIIYIALSRMITKGYDLRFRVYDIKFLIEKFDSIFNINDDLIIKNDKTMNRKLFGVDSYMMMLFMMTVLNDLILITSGISLLVVIINNLVTPTLIVIIVIRDTEKKCKERIKEIHIELPIVLQQYYCMISINYTIKEALANVMHNIDDQYLKREFGKLHESLESGYDLAEALNLCFTEGRSLYLSRFKGTMLSFYYYGNDETKESFINLINDLMQNRVNLLKEKGEKIKVKMVFPIILIFVASMISLGAPMIMGLNF